MDNLEDVQASDERLAEAFARAEYTRHWRFSTADGNELAPWHNMNDPDDAQVGVKANIIVHRVKIFIILPYCQHYSNYPCLPPYIGRIKQEIL